ncbi:hypothetical protein ES703_32394 [subsurface metagenome]
MITFKYPMNTKTNVLDGLMGFQLSPRTKWLHQMRKIPNRLHETKNIIAKSLRVGIEYLRDINRYATKINEAKTYVSITKYLHLLLDMKCVVIVVIAILSRIQNIQRRISRIQPSFQHVLGRSCFQYSQNMCQLYHKQEVQKC